MSKRYESRLELQQKVLNGVKKLSEIVSSTLGPRGNTVLLHQRGYSPGITKDGATIAKFFGELTDPIENSAAEVAKQSAVSTERDAGDGTTTTTLLTYAILKEAQKYLITGIPAIELKRGIDKAVEKVVEYLDFKSIPIRKKEDILHIVTISANGDEMIGNLIATAVDQIGKDGSITIEEARSLETSLSVIEGFRIDSGYYSKEFVTDERRMVMKYHNPLLLVTDERIEFVEQILPTLTLVAREKRPIVIVADEIVDQALAAVIMNAVRGSLKVAALKAPRYGQERRDILSDLALSTGATFVTKSKGVKLEEIKLEHFGNVNFVEASRTNSTFVGGKGNYEEIEQRIDSLKEEIKQIEDLHECEKIQERITRLASGVAIIHVGGNSEVEVLEKKHRIEDSLEAVKSAQAEGLLPGGGIALLKASNEITISNLTEEQMYGYNIVLKAIKEPFRQILLNAGEKVDLIENDIMKNNKEFSYGYDVPQKQYTCMYKAGILDPTKVTKCALKNAASVATTLLTTNYAIVEEK
jgi:chaperonin GroEL